MKRNKNVIKKTEQTDRTDKINSEQRFPEQQGEIKKHGIKKEKAHA